LDYEISASTKRSRLSAIREEGRGGGFLPPVEFTWQEGDGDFTTRIWGEKSAYFGDDFQSGQGITGDYDPAIGYELAGNVEEEMNVLAGDPGPGGPDNGISRTFRVLIIMSVKV
jgi:hypothetical protein